MDLDERDRQNKVNVNFVSHRNENL